MDVGFHLGQNLLLDLSGGLVLVGSRFCQSHRVDPGGTVERSELLENVAGLRVVAKTRVGRLRGFHLCIFEHPDPLGATFDLALELAIGGLELVDPIGVLGGLLPG